MCAVRIEELKERLQNVGIAVSEKTLRRWGAEGFIHDHLSTTKLPGIGRGNVEEWLEESFEEAAAFHEVRYIGIVKPRALTKEMFETIKDRAEDIYTTGSVICIIPPITRWIGGLQGVRFPDQLQIRLVPDHDPLDEILFSGFREREYRESVDSLNEKISLFPGNTPEEKADVLNKLLIVWITAIEKARYTERARTEGRDNGVWPITKTARVSIHFAAKAGKERDLNGKETIGVRRKYVESELEDADTNEIVLYENEEDVRQLTLRALSQHTLDLFGPPPFDLAHQELTKYDTPNE
jgi:hypothetical protein